MVYAKSLDAGKTREGSASGEVELFRLDQHMRTERILFDPVEETVVLPGPLSYEDQQVWLNAGEGRYDFTDDSGRFSLIDYGLAGSSANGSAEYVELIGGHTSELHKLDYTSCPGEQPDWQLYARELELKHEDGRGVARGAKLIFKGVPILYAPYFTFPIDDRRKSGFLYPNFGQTSDSGLEIGAPWYWNIAPNQDATLEPRYFSKRGFMLTGEYRLLTRRTNGSVEFDYMPDDRVVDDNRFRYLVEHNAYPTRRWNSRIIVHRVSDNRYFQDFGTKLAETSLQFLRSSGTLTGVGRYWDFELMIDDFQILDESITPQNQPYRRLPRLGYRLDRPLGQTGLFFGLNSELVYFDRDIGATGARFDLYPNIYWSRYTSWGFIKPSVGMRYTGYDLDSGSTSGNKSPSRSTAIASLDAGLIFDRTSASGDVQTIQPRLFYLYVPYEDQTDLPNFDTGEFTFGYSQLFNTNRFAGSDRQGDANQLSLAVTARHMDGVSGAELWSLSLGQIFYFDDRRVQLEGTPSAQENASPFLGEFTWHLWSRFSLVAGMQWNWDQRELDVGTLGFNYRGKKGERLRFEYRYRRDRVDQFDLRAFWPINERWRVLSRVNYSFADSDMLEIQGGVEYESCCWAIRAVVRRYLKNRDGDYRDSIYLELNLKGLTSVGNKSQQLFRD
ncbi:MAG: LPS assembly protein LptD [Xanthomonadales bacterium]|nr:LPS assembly protein LptD [Gammaproteobacteria bacterium]MBT8054798.1 LPS assembly protein LptD [Gammaproteobacteria bacterium]NND56870.1 LPS assembly protein LptD [Xanthomonadales bacterium]